MLAGSSVDYTTTSDFGLCGFPQVSQSGLRFRYPPSAHYH